MLKRQNLGISKIKEILIILFYLSPRYIFLQLTHLKPSHVCLCMFYILPSPISQDIILSAQLKQFSDFSVVSFAKGNYDGIVSKSLIA